VVMSGHTSRSRHVFVVGVSVTVHPDGQLAIGIGKCLLNRPLHENPLWARRLK
jgi:hypothetical protein